MRVCRAATACCLLLVSGGALVYCTCTLDPRQNAAVVAAALRQANDSLAHDANASDARSSGDSVHVAYRVEPLYDALHEGFGEHFNLLPQADPGVSVAVPVAASADDDDASECRGTNQHQQDDDDDDGDDDDDEDDEEELGVLVVPCLARNSGPLFIAKIVRE